MISEIEKILSSNRDGARAQKMSDYMRNLFPFFGITSPQRKILNRSILAKLKGKSLEEIIDISLQLWSKDEREFHYVAMEIVDRYKKKFTKEHLPFAETLVLNKSWWDSVDFLATHLFGPILHKMTQADLSKYVRYLAHHDNMWMNRIAIIFQLQFKDDTNTKMLEIAILPHLESTEFFHKKAIGWALRQYSKFNPEYVRNFLNKHQLSKLSVREASKYL